MATTHILLRDGVEIKRGTHNDLLIHLQKIQGQSWDYALKYGGYSIGEAVTKNRRGAMNAIDRADSLTLSRAYGFFQSAKAAHAWLLNHPACHKRIYRSRGFGSPEGMILIGDIEDAPVDQSHYYEITDGELALLAS